jgi:DNA mismatch repair protein MutL
MTGLVDQLFSSSTPNYTPDGRLIVTTITDEEIGKVFK